jgi:hypothetical protein
MSTDGQGGFGGGGFVRLENPVSHHFQAFVVGNAAEYEKRFPAKEPRDIYIPSGEFNAFVPWVEERLQRFPRIGQLITRIYLKLGKAYIKEAQIRLPYCDKVVQQNFAKDQTVVICGAGPSLKEEAAEWIPKGDHVWACNSALPWLIEQGYRVTHGFTIDQTPQMLEEWHSAPDVEYLLASTVHPHLTDYLLSQGRDIAFFHNFVGIKEKPVTWPDENGVMREESWEDWAYQIMYAGTVRAGSGLNAVTRAIDVALFGGAKEIIVLGADCCLRFKKEPPKDKGPGTPEFEQWLIEETVMHADGGHALASGATPVVLTGKIDGRLFAVKPDLVITAVWLVVMARKLKGRLKLVGDGLPNALKHKSNKFLERLPSLVDSEGKPVSITIGDIEEAA